MFAPHVTAASFTGAKSWMQPGVPLWSMDEQGASFSLGEEVLHQHEDREDLMPCKTSQVERQTSCDSTNMRSLRRSRS